MSVCERERKQTTAAQRTITTSLKEQHVLGESAIATQMATSNKKHMATSDRKFKVKVNGEDTTISHAHGKPSATAMHDRTAVAQRDDPRS